MKYDQISVMFKVISEPSLVELISKTVGDALVKLLGRIAKNHFLLQQH